LPTRVRSCTAVVAVSVGRGEAPTVGAGEHPASSNNIAADPKGTSFRCIEAPAF
jgi:hypothetical protein